MYLRYGNHTHPLGEAAIAITKEMIENEAGEPYAVRERWTISGMVIGTSPTSIKTQLTALDTAYSANGKNLSLLMPDKTESTHRMISSACQGGVRVIQRPSFPNGGGAEHVTKREYMIVLEGIVLLSSSQVILSFEEVLSFSGGGPRYGHLEPLEGPPIKQRLKQSTPYVVTQEGQAVGLYGYPAIPPSIWPGDKTEAPRIRRYSPRKKGGNYYEYKVSWAYEFKAAYPLTGSPHVWTV
jgi:hypothetical protein